MTKRFVCRVADIPRNGMRECKADDGFKVLVANAGDSYFAYQAMCPHQEVPLCEGLYDGERLTCHQHLWQWNIRTGSPLGFAEVPLQYFDVQIEDGAIYIAPTSPLNQAELFIGISGSTLTELNKVMQREEHEAGTTLYHPGDPAEDLYVVDGGRVEFLIGREGHTSPAGFVLRQGEVFGWAALLDKQSTRIAKATCLEKSSVLRISGQEVLKILQKDPLSGFVVMSRLSLLIMRHLRQQA